MSTEGKSMVAPGPAAPAPSEHRAASLSWLSSVPVGRRSSASRCAISHEANS